MDKEEKFEVVCFNLSQVDPRIAAFLNLAGIDEQILADPNKRKEVENFVNENKEVFEKLPRQPSMRRQQRGQSMCR